MFKKELLELLNQLQDNYQLEIEIYNPGVIGGTPTVSIEKVSIGFDWDSGKIIFIPSKPLTILNKKELLLILKSARKGQSYQAYQREKTLKEEIKKLKEKLKNASICIETTK